MASVNRDRHRVALPTHKLMKAAVVMLAMLFVMLRPVCEVFAASGEWHAPAVSEHGKVKMADASAGEDSDEGICCASVDAQVLTVPETAPLPAMSPDMPAAPSSAVLQISIPRAVQTNFVAQHDPSPPRSYHARSLRRLD